MYSSMIKMFRLIKNKKLLMFLLSMNTSGYLREIGWIESFNNKKPINNDFEPIPWVTYSFIDFISPRLTNKMNVFEFGSGNSTLWYSKKVKSVLSVENDESWYKSIKESMPTNSELLFEELHYGGEYSKTALKSNRKFDIISVDGRDRVNCIKNSISIMSDAGIIILDDSEREDYVSGCEFLSENGFKSIEFWGISPGYFYRKCTTIFYRNKNCLGI